MRFAAASLLLLQACDGPPPSLGDASASRVVDVEAIDGSTVRVEGEALRLAGIDSPKLAPQARCYAEALLAREGRRVLQEELDGPASIELSTDERSEADTVRVVVNGRDLSSLMVERGLAASSLAPLDWCAPMDSTRRQSPALAESPGDPAPLPPKGDDQRKGEAQR